MEHAMAPGITRTNELSGLSRHVKFRDADNVQMCVRPCGA